MTAPPLRRGARLDPPALTPWETIGLTVLAAAFAAGLLVWGTGWVASGGRMHTPLSAAPQLVVELLASPGDPAAAWPEAERAALPGPIVFYGTAAALLLLPTVGGTLLALRLRDRRRAEDVDARWARGRDLTDLAIDDPDGDRVVLGTHHPSGRLLATEPGRSLLVLGPSRSGKTTGLAIPAILEWEGPVVATSVKTDLVRDTAGWRAQRGRVLLYDPTGSTGMPAASWSPLAGCDSWMGAVRTAQTMAATVKTTGTAGGLTDGDFWYASAAKLLAPLLFAAAANDRPIADVVRWLNTQEVKHVQRLLATAGVPQAVDAFIASIRRAENQRSSIYTTAETVLAAYEDPVVAASAETSTIDPDGLLAGSDTLFLCAPRDDQRRLRPLFVGLLQQVIAAAGRRAAAQPSGQLDRPLLIVLDEAANIAPLPDLDELASTAMGLGITLVTIWQDLAQITARYGTRAPTIVNNHAGMLVLRGMRDLEALRATSDLLGRHTPPEEPGSLRTPPSEPLLPAHALRGLPEGRAVGIYQHLLPFQVDLRPHYDTRHLRRRATTALPVQAAAGAAAVQTASGEAVAVLDVPADPPPTRSAVPSLIDVRAHAADLVAAAAEHEATDLRVFGSVATGTAVAGSDINVLVDIPPTRRLLHLSTLSKQFSDLLGHRTQLLTVDMLQNPEAATTAVLLAPEPEGQP